MFDPLRSAKPRRPLAEELPGPVTQRGFPGALRAGRRSSSNRVHDAGWVSPDVFSPAMSRSSSIDSSDGAMFKMHLASPQPTGLWTQALPPVPAAGLFPDPHVLHQLVADYLGRPLSVISFNREKTHHPKKRPCTPGPMIALSEIFGVYHQRTPKGATIQGYAALNGQYFAARSLAFNVLYATDQITLQTRPQDIDKRIDELLIALSKMGSNSATSPSARHASNVAAGD